MKERVRLIDQMIVEIAEKDLLNEITCISLSRKALEELKKDYSEEFESELFESGRKVSDQDIRDYFGKDIVIQPQADGKKYSLLKPV